MRIPPDEFESLVAQSLDRLPDGFAELVENLAVVVEEEPDAEEMRELGLEPGEDELFGLYQGVPIGERGSFYDALPDRVVIYRGPILRVCRSRREVMREVRDTVVHELGHYFGLGDEEMPY